MRQPEVARLGRLLLAVVLVAPVLVAAARLLIAGLFVVEFLSAGALRPLSAVTRAPVREPGAHVDRWRPVAVRRVPLVLVHGYAPEGKDAAAVQQAAALLARAGFEVTAPTIPGLTRGRLRPDDVEAVVAALVDQPRPAVVVAVSVGAGPGLLAAADPRARHHVRAVLSLGGYASARELVRFFVSGEYAWGAMQGRVVHDPAIVRAFVDINGDLLDDSLRAALTAGDGARVAAALDRLPPRVVALLDRLSPERVLGDVLAPVWLVHGRDDRAVPYTETLRLAAARPRRTTVALVGVIGHVEGVPARVTRARDLATLVLVAYALLAV